MFGALLKKQLLELNRFYFQDKKTGKNRSKSGVIGMTLLFAFVFLSVAFAFFGVSDALGSMLIPAGKVWLYFAMMGMLSIALGVFGSVFNTYAGLYLSKDNDLLLSMPIRPSMILISRMVSVYLMSLLYTALVWVPTSIQYWIVAEPGTLTVRAVIFEILLTFILSLFVSVLTCLLGYVVAIISKKLKNKSFVTVLITLLFLGAYYFVYFRISSFLESLLLVSDEIGNVVKTWIYPIWQLGLAAEGQILPMLIFTAITAVAFALCLFCISRSFIKVATTSAAGKKTEYREKTVKAENQEKALLRKELKRYTASSVYMLNTGLGLIFMPALAIAALIKAPALGNMLAMVSEEIPFITGLIPVAGIAGLCLILSMNAVTAPSISLEGKNIWIVQSMPIDPRKILRAKMKLHLLLNIPVAFVSAILFFIAVKADVLTALTGLALIAAYTFFMAVIGLAMNLKRPNLEWTNEAIPVKQGMAVFVCIFGGMILSLLIGGGYAAVAFALGILQMMFPAWAYLLIAAAVIAGISLLIFRWIMKRGAQIFNEL